ncbi:MULTISPECIES: transcriptional regulator [unclassified Colwellia]|uniref:winged helix-turn-helix domain-containing protein n=1 Tax=unclassified Colwellia TaxID=196834 RepID=UPI0015F50F7D|nr:MULTISPECIES: transcriptional regulator [unclassified Colwellia]MBA6357666.1 transcriptional regulator [Colwellia sp. BRX8-3]MBA6358580.1 transcriptional regulator [Colwellia sp. BRX8-6]MBA6366769.1 transcriptional regulator [Colwellia sp. BRX8-5]MBA6376661.1 transcriptional regulator [Colwellia sp. BRX8-2]MBA6378382.1 transcriptional regulator [Colwellia sp. BRX10-7]
MNIAQFDSIIHAPNRLQICSLLVPIEDAEFQLIRDQLGVSDSVLSKHVKQLEDAGYVKQRKEKVNGRLRTWLYLTEAGRRAFEGHVAELMRIVQVSDL